MRRRSKRKYTWFPIIGTRVGVEGEQYDVTFGGFPALTPNPNSGAPPNEGDPTFGDSGIQALVPDRSIEESGHSNTSSLRDLTEGQDWLLKRIVGNIFVAAGPDSAPGGSTNADVWSSLMVTVGILVARSQDDNPDSPDFTTNDEFDPMAVNNAMNPWVWRRTWWLGPPGEASNTWQGVLPNTNTEYGDMRSGPHIDSKVSRRITKEHRLWLTARVIGYDPLVQSVALAQNVQPFATIVTDLRILGAMRKGRNKSSF